MENKNQFYILPNVLVSELNNCIELDPPNFTKAGRRSGYKFKYDYFLYFLNLIIVYSSRDDNETNECSINTKFLQKTKNNYKIYLKYLHKHRLINIKEIASSYKKRTNRYSVNIDYLIGEWIVLPVTNKKLCKSIDALKIDNLPITPLYKSLVNYQKKLVIDHMSANSYILNKYLNLSDFKSIKRKMVIMNFVSGNLYMRRGSKVNRIYSSFTGMPKDLRQFLSIDGEPLMECDIKSCQLVTLLILYKEHLKKQGITTMPDDAVRFAKMVQIGSDVDIYEYLMHKMRCEGVKVGSRDEFKEKIMFKVLNGPRTPSRKRMPKGDEPKIFIKGRIQLIKLTDEEYLPFHTLSGILKNEFPSIMKFLNTLKKPTYKRINKIMVDKEASIIIETIGDKIIKDRPDIKFVTCHDAIYCTASHAEQVKKIIEDEYYKGFGIIPNVVVEVLHA